MTASQLLGAAMLAPEARAIQRACAALRQKIDRYIEEDEAE